MKPSITFIVPALNEEGNLSSAINEILGALGNTFSDYEILIFDDGSIDRTGKIADELAATNKNIKVIHNKTTRGFGFNYREGVKLARCDYIIMIPGDNEIPGSATEEILSRIGSADIVIPYILNKEVRSPLRRMISRTGMALINLLFGLRIRYYNGPVLHRSSIIKEVPLRTNSFAYQIEALVKLLKSGYSYTEVGINIQIRKYGKTKIFRIKNLLSVAATAIRLFWEINFKRR